MTSVLMNGERYDGGPEMGWRQPEGGMPEMTYMPDVMPGLQPVVDDSRTEIQRGYDPTVVDGTLDKFKKGGFDTPLPGERKGPTVH